MTAKRMRYAQRFTIALGFGLVMVGCGPTLPYAPKELEKGARTVTVAKTTPYNCKLLGEAEGKDNAEGKISPSYEQIREGALNDLRNTAADVAHGKRAMVSPTKEKMVCSKIGFFGGRSGRFDCSLETMGKKTAIENLRIHAQVFDCGEK